MSKVYLLITKTSMIGLTIVVLFGCFYGAFTAFKFVFNYLINQL